MEQINIKGRKAGERVRCIEWMVKMSRWTAVPMLVLCYRDEKLRERLRDGGNNVCVSVHGKDGEFKGYRVERISEGDKGVQIKMAI